MAVDDKLLTELIHYSAGMWTAKALSVAVELRFADHLRTGPKTTSDLADLCNADEECLYRLIRALACEAIFKEVSPRTFANTPASEFLRSDHESSLANLARLYSSPTYLRTWEHLRRTIQTGAPAFEQAYGKKRWDHFDTNEEDAALFNLAMSEWAKVFHSRAISGLRICAEDRVVDVGGGTGQLLGEILRAHEQTTGILLEIPAAVGQATEHFKALGIESRVEVVTGDFLASVPCGGSVYILAHILIDWDDNQARKILINCRQSMTTSARLVILDHAISGVNQRSFAKLLDLQVMVMFGGRVRTYEEFEELLGETGFRVDRFETIPNGPTVIEASLRR